MKTSLASIPESAPAVELHAIEAEILADRTNGVAEFKSLCERWRDFPNGFGAAAWNAAVRGLHHEAIAYYQKLQVLEPDNLEVKWRIADRMVNLGRLNEAEEMYQIVARLDKDCHEATMGIRYVDHLRRRASKATAGAKPFAVSPKTASSPERLANYKLNQEEFESNKIHLKSLPTDLYLESTTKCNFFCKTCTKGYEAYHAEDLQEPVRELVRNEVMPTNNRISITGFGEPTLSGDFDEILKMSVENGSKVHFVTNASLLSFERLEQLNSTAVDITISFDGATKKTFEEVRAGSNFDRTLDKLAMIKKVRDIYPSEVKSTWCFNFVALACNIAELADVVRIAHRYGIGSVGVADYAFNNNEFDKQSLRYEAAKANRCIEEAQEVAAKLGVRLLAPSSYDETAGYQKDKKPTFWQKLKKNARLLPAPDRFPRKCSSPWKEPYITTSGIVTPCCVSPKPMGDLKRENFRTVWNGWRYKMLRLRIHSHLPPPQCRTCFVAWGVNGGNAGNSMAKEGLIIKGLYWIEFRLRFIAQRLSNTLLGIRRRFSATPTSADPAPNYFKGRPLKTSDPNPLTEPQ